MRVREKLNIKKRVLNQLGITQHNLDKIEYSDELNAAKLDCFVLTVGAFLIHRNNLQCESNRINKLNDRLCTDDLLSNDLTSRQYAVDRTRGVKLADQKFKYQQNRSKSNGKKIKYAEQINKTD